MSQLLTLSLVLSGIRLAVPVLLAALGGLVCERAGVINIALEGQMLLGAFTGVLVTWWTSSPAAGFAAALLAGGLAGLAHAWISVHLGADQVVAGTAWNLVALGLTSALIAPIWGQPGASEGVTTLRPIVLPGLPDLSAVDWLAFAAVGLVWATLYRTPWGMRLRACGEDPHAAVSAGLDVVRLRYTAVIASGAFAGLAGAYLSLVQVGVFNRGMTQGRGFLALAAMIFAKWRPLRLLAVCLLFGLTDAFQYRAQAAGVDLPHELLLALPYVTALAALGVFAARASAPAALGRPFRSD